MKVKVWRIDPDQLTAVEVSRIPGSGSRSYRDSENGSKNFRVWGISGMVFILGLVGLWIIPPSKTELPMKSTALLQTAPVIVLKTSPGPGPAANRPPRVRTITVGPRPLVAGAQLRAEAAGEDPEGDEVLFTYYWRINETEVAVTSDEEVPDVDLKKHDRLRVRVVPSDGELEGKAMESALLVVQNRPPRITSRPGADFQEDLYTYSVEARDPDGDPIRFRIQNGPDGMVIDPSSGLITWPILPELQGEIRAVVIAADDDGAEAFQQFTLSFNP